MTRESSLLRRWSTVPKKPAATRWRAPLAPKSRPATAHRHLEAAYYFREPITTLSLSLHQISLFDSFASFFLMLLFFFSVLERSLLLFGLFPLRLGTWLLHELLLYSCPLTLVATPLARGSRRAWVCGFPIDFTSLFPRRAANLSDRAHRNSLFFFSRSDGGPIFRGPAATPTRNFLSLCIVCFLCGFARTSDMGTTHVQAVVVGGVTRPSEIDSRPCQLAVSTPISASGNTLPVRTPGILELGVYGTPSSTILPRECEVCACCKFDGGTRFGG